MSSVKRRTGGDGRVGGVPKTPDGLSERGCERCAALRGAALHRPNPAQSNPARRTASPAPPRARLHQDFTPCRATSRVAYLF